MTNHEAYMRRAMHMADTARIRARPNPWVGAVVVCRDGKTYDGATHRAGGPHAEIDALNAARDGESDLAGATLYCTLEPCNHTGRTGPCTEAIIAAGISHVVIGISDPDSRVSGLGIQQLRAAGINVEVGVCEDDIAEQLHAYLHHRRTGRPLVMLKMATTLDARTALPDGPRWITGQAAQSRVHELRSLSDVIVVGSGTVFADDPELTVRHVDGPSPRRIVLSRTGEISSTAKVQPCTVWSAELEDLLDTLGAQGVLQVMVEGGPTIATAFHERGLIDRYVFHVAPIVCGAVDAPGVFIGSDIDMFSTHTLVSTTVLGDDIEIVLKPNKEKV